MDNRIILPHVVAEVAEAFYRYEDGLINNKVSVLDELFYHAVVMDVAGMWKRVEK